MLHKYETIEKLIEDKYIVWYLIIAMMSSRIINIAFFNKSLLGNYIVLSIGLVTILMLIIMCIFNSVILVKELTRIFKDKKLIK